MVWTVDYSVEKNGVRFPGLQRIQKYFSDVPFEIFVNPPWTVQRYFHEEAESGRIITAHMLATGFIVLAAEPIVNALIDEAKRILHSRPTVPHNLTVPRYMIATREATFRIRLRSWVMNRLMS
jgi:hypothetical protein